MTAKTELIFKVTITLKENKQDKKTEKYKPYRIFTGKVRLVKIISMRHMTTPKFAFKNNRSIWAY